MELGTEMKAVFAANNGKLLQFLQAIGSSEWNCKNHRGMTFLHMACRRSNNIDSIILLSKYIDVNSKTRSGSTPLNYAVEQNNVRAMKVLLLLGANMKTKDHNRYSALDNAILGAIKLGDIRLDERAWQVLISNGCRLRNSELRFDSAITCEMINFEQGLVRCRDAVVTLLGLKKYRRILPRLDRFLIQQELAVAIWSTRSCENDKWQT